MHDTRALPSCSQQRTFVLCNPKYLQKIGFQRTKVLWWGAGQSLTVTHIFLSEREARQSKIEAERSE